jgi:hypothetical protein
VKNGVDAAGACDDRAAKEKLAPSIACETE